LKGKIQNVGIEPIFRLHHSKIEDFIGRRKEMHQIISAVMQSRLVTIKGIPGIGKTSLAKSVAFYLDERFTFKDGIILQSLRGVESTHMFVTRLFLLLSKYIVDQEPETPTNNENLSKADMNIILEKMLVFLEDKQILFVLDNVEDILSKDPKLFKDVLNEIFNRCSLVRILTTTLFPIGQIGDITENKIEIKELTPNFSIELLQRKAMREITKQEIDELLKTISLRQLHSNPLQRKQIPESLEDHHMTALLGGHPHAISLAAPLLQDKSLKELY